MARRIRWQIVIASVSAALVLGLMGYLALTTAAVARPVAGGVYTEYDTSQPDQINPLTSDPARDPVAADLHALVFDGLMRIGDDGFPEPALARAWPTIDETGTVYTFALRPNVAWHDGQPLTVDDVLFTLRAVQSPGFVGDPTTGRVWRNVLLERIDDLTFRATLPQPRGAFLSYATFPILPEHLLGEVSPDQWSTTTYNQQPVGTGPYRFAEPLSAERALLVANTTYYRGRPYLDSIEVRFGQNPQDALTALGRNESVGFGVSSTNDQSRANVPRGSNQHAIPLAAYTTLSFNLRIAPLDDQGLRRALVLATDKQALIDQVLEGQGQRLETPVLPGWWAADPALELPQANTEAASEALTSLGYELGADGNRARDGSALVLSILTDDAPDHIAAAQVIASRWAALGIQTQVEQVDAATLEQRLTSHQFTVALHGWQRQGSDPDAVYALWHSSGAETGFNYPGLQDVEIDALLTEGRESADTEVRRAAYIAFQRRWVDLAPGITLYQPLFLYTAIGNLGGLKLDAQVSDEGPVRPLLLGREDRFRNITGWYLQSGREIRGDLRETP